MQARWGLVFSGSSVVAPVVLGVVVGAIASGRLERAVRGDDTFAWLSPFPLAVGLFAPALFAFLAATYLAVETEGALRDDFRRRAIGAGVAVFLAALLAGLLSWREAPLVFAGLTRRGWSLPLHLATGAAAVTAFLALRSGLVRRARAAAVVQVTLIVLGWGASQYPYLIVPHLTLESASAPRSVQVPVLWALGAGAVLLFPALYLLSACSRGAALRGDRPLAGPRAPCRLRGGRPPRRLGQVRREQCPRPPA